MNTRTDKTMTMKTATPRRGNFQCSMALTSGFKSSATNPPTNISKHDVAQSIQHHAPEVHPDDHEDRDQDRS